MIVGIPREIKISEFRVGLTPASVRELTGAGHRVLVETQAGAGIGMNDDAYLQAGAEICADAAAVFAAAEMIVKVKEPQPAERAMLREGQVLFTYLHLAADAGLTRDLMASGCTAIAYETVTGPDRTLPLLAPMSEVAGRLSIQAGAHCLEKAHGGAGVLLGGVPGVAPASVVIIGGGVVGENAAIMAMGMEADVTVFDRSLPRLRELDFEFGSRVRCLYATRDAIEKAALSADLVVGAVLVPGAAAPRLLSAEDVKAMKPGSVLVDVAIDQGGCFETSRPTTHAEPTYMVDDVVHYCVANMPGVVPLTSTYALNNATLPFVLALAAMGAAQAMLDDEDLLNGLNVQAGKVTNAAVAAGQDIEYHDARVLLEG